MKNQITSNEIEITAKLSLQDYKRLKNSFAKKLKHTKSQKRLSIRFFKDKVDVREPIDIRYKWTNGFNTLVIKKGALGSQSRQETTIELGENNQLDHFTTMFELLGYKTGNAIYREMERYESKFIEAALTQAFGQFFVEVESINTKDKKQAMLHLSNFFEEFKIVPLSKSEYQKYLRYLDKTINLHFPLSKYPEVFEKAEWKEVINNTILKS